MRDSVVIYKSFFEASKNMSPEEFKELWVNLFQYSLNEEDPEEFNSPMAEAIFTMAVPQIDANKKRQDGGNKGGRPKNTLSEKEKTNGYENEKPMVIENKNHRLENQKPNDNVNDNDNDNVNIKEKIYKKEKSAEVRHKHGVYKNVLLTDTDLEKLKKEFPADYEERIEKLSLYMKSKKKTYDDHLATIRNWSRMEKERLKQAQESTAQKNGVGIMKTEYDMAALEQKLLGG